MMMATIDLIYVNICIYIYVCMYTYLLIRAPPAVIPEEGEGDDETTMTNNSSGRV